MSVASVGTSLLYHVSAVVSCCAEENMIGADTGRIVAPVANEQLGRGDRPIGELVGGAMRSTATKRRHVRYAIPLRVPSTCPYPTVARCVNE